MNKALEIFNRIFEIDPNAIHALICNMVPCNETLANDPIIRVKQNRVISDDAFCIDLLSVINSILLESGQLQIYPEFAIDNDGKTRLVGFCEAMY